LIHHAIDVYADDMFCIEIKFFFKEIEHRSDRLPIPECILQEVSMRSSNERLDVRSSVLFH
jgi:hypothetical protein